MPKNDISSALQLLRGRNLRFLWYHRLEQLLLTHPFTADKITVDFTQMRHFAGIKGWSSSTMEYIVSYLYGSWEVRSDWAFERCRVRSWDWGPPILQLPLSHNMAQSASHYRQKRDYPLFISPQSVSLASRLANKKENPFYSIPPHHIGASDIKLQSG